MKNIYKISFFISLLFYLNSCQTFINKSVNEVSDSGYTNPAAEIVSAPVMKVPPSKPGEGDYKILSSDKFRISVIAPDAQEVELFYKPVTADDRLIKLKTLNAANAGTEARFEVELPTPQDFNGEVWARIHYADGTTKETGHLQLVAPVAAGKQPFKRTGAGGRQRQHGT